MEEFKYTKVVMHTKGKVEETNAVELPCFFYDVFSAPYNDVEKNSQVFELNQAYPTTCSSKKHNRRESSVR